MKKFRVIRKDSGLKSGSREVSLTEALKYPVYNPVQRKFIYHEAFMLSNPVQNPGSRRIYLLQKKLKVAEEDLLPGCVVQTWVSRLTGLTYY